MTSARRYAALLLVSSILGCGETPPTGSADGGDEPSVPEPASMEGVTFILADEFDPYAEVESVLPTLADYPEVAICLAIRPAESSSDELASLLRAAAAEGVPVIAWMLLPEEDGYWFNETNSDEARTVVLAFLDWIEEELIPLRWILFDMEMGLEQTAVMESGDLLGTVLPMLQENVDPEAYETATAAYSELVLEVKGRGYVVTAAAYPFIIDDLLDDDHDIQDAFNTPIVGVPFDEVYYMAYRTTFTKLTGMEPGPHLIYQYAHEAYELFGEQAVIGLGTIGDIGMVSDIGFNEPSELAEDVAAARAGGNERIFIFSLDGMLDVGPLEDWLDLAATNASEPEPDTDSSFIRTIFTALDDLL